MFFSLEKKVFTGVDQEDHKMNGAYDKDNSLRMSDDGAMGLHLFVSEIKGRSVDSDPF